MEIKTKKTVERAGGVISDDIYAAVKKMKDLSQDYKLEERRDEIIDDTRIAKRFGVPKVQGTFEDLKSIEKFIKEHPVGGMCGACGGRRLYPWVDDAKG